MAKKNEKKMTLGEIGFAMKAEACRVDGETLVVSKALWKEIADILMLTDQRLKEIERSLKRVIRNGK